MLTLTHTPTTGDAERVVLGDSSSGIAVSRIHMPRRRRVSNTPTRGGAAVAVGAYDLLPITVSGSVAVRKVGVQAAPLRLDDLQTLERWQVQKRRVTVTYKRPVWTTARAYSAPVETLGFHYVTELDPTYTGLRLGAPTRVDWRVVLQPEGVTGRVF